MITIDRDPRYAKTHAALTRKNSILAAKVEEAEAELEQGIGPPVSIPLSIHGVKGAKYHKVVLVAKRSHYRLIFRVDSGSRITLLALVSREEADRVYKQITKGHFSEGCVSFYSRSFHALFEADDERLRRLAAMGDPNAQATLLRHQARGAQIDWEALCRRWTSPGMGEHGIRVASPETGPLSRCETATSSKGQWLMVYMAFPRGWSGTQGPLRVSMAYLVTGSEVRIDSIRTFPSYWQHSVDAIGPEHRWVRDLLPFAGAIGKHATEFYSVEDFITTFNRRLPLAS